MSVFFDRLAGKRLEDVVHREKTAWAKYVLSYLGKRKSRLALICLLISLSSVLGLSIPASIKSIFGNVGVSYDASVGLTIAVACVLSMAAKYCIDLLYRTLSAKMTAAVFKDMVGDLYDHLLRLGMDFFINTKSGEFMQSFDQDMYVISRVIMNDFQVLFSSALQLTLMIAFLAYLNPLLMSICLAFVPAYYFLKNMADGDAKKANAIMLRSWGDASGNIHDTLSGIKAIQVAGAEAFCSKRNDLFLKEVSSAFSSLEIQTAKTSVVTAMFNQLIPFLVMILGFLAYKAKGISQGSLFAFFYVVSGFFAPFGAMVIIGNSVQKGRQSVERVVKYLGIESDIRDSDRAKGLGVVKGRIAFDKVSFGYDGRDVLGDISFTINEGERVSIAGSSGSGKTTVLSLLFRFYDPRAGSVKLDGEDIKGIRLSDYRKRIGYVGQETILFHASFLDNLMLADEGATIDEIYEACALAGIHEEILKTGEGYKTVIGEKGMKLSGGQRQRLSLARMILKKPSIVVFDEAFSNLDSESEGKFFESAKDLFKGKTTIVVSHRLASLVDSDRIIYLENGKIIDIDRHKNLIERNGKYRELWKNQLASNA